MEDIGSYIEEIAQLRKELFGLQEKFRKSVAHEVENGYLIGDLKSEIDRHHKDFLRIADLVERGIQAAIRGDGDEALSIFKTIQNIVG